MTLAMKHLCIVYIKKKHFLEAISRKSPIVQFHTDSPALNIHFYVTFTDKLSFAEYPPLNVFADCKMKVLSNFKQADLSMKLDSRGSFSTTSVS